METESPTLRHRRLAHALVRIFLGVDILLHGLTRIPQFSAFAEKLQHQFAHTFLAPSLIQASAYVIVGGETIVGFLILTGLWLRGALVAGLLLMILLGFGTALIQEWNTAGLQLTYVAVYGALLATLEYDRYSVDACRR